MIVSAGVQTVAENSQFVVLIVINDLNNTCYINLGYVGIKTYENNLKLKIKLFL